MIFKVAAEFIRESFGFSEEEFHKINQQRHLALKQGKSDELFWTIHAKEMGIDLPDNWYQSL